MAKFALLLFGSVIDVRFTTELEVQDWPTALLAEL